MHVLRPVVAAIAAAAVALPLISGPATGAPVQDVAAALPTPLVGPERTSLAVLASARSSAPTGGGITRVDLLDGAQPVPAEDTVGLLSVDGAPTAPSDELVLERTLPTDGAVVIGIAWAPETSENPGALIRFRSQGTWSGWTEVDMEETDEDDENDAIAPVMSESMVAAGSDAVQIRLVGIATAPVRDAEVLLVDGGEGDLPVSAAAVSPQHATRPTIIPRTQWGANDTPPRSECVNPSYGSRLDRFVVHHTAGGNTYSAADVPAIMRGIQRFHVESRGWCDVGYNFMVDKFGRIFEGRRGGVEELVVGVHASGHNTNTVGLSVLGDYTQVAPTTVSLDALTRVIGWKSYLHGVDPTTSALKDGKMMRRVIGHREVASTACPGAIQNHLTTMASRARDLMLSYVPEFEDTRVSDGALAGDPGGVRATIPVPASWTLTVTDPSGQVALRRQGDVTRRTTVSTTFPLASEGVVAPGRYTVTLAGRTTNGVSFRYSDTLRLTGPRTVVPMDRRGVVETTTSASTTETRTLTTTGLGLPRHAAAALVVRVCSSGAAQVRLGASDLPVGFHTVVRPAGFPDRCALALVGVGTAGEVQVSRPEGSPSYRLDVLGHTPAPAVGVPFWDVRSSSPFVSNIGWVATQGISTGHVDGTYRPGQPVGRQAMAAFLYRAAGSPAFTPPAQPTFTDVSASHPFHLEIEWLAAQGIARGNDLGDGRFAFRPRDNISRQAMAAFLYRAYDGRPVSGPAPFTDVASSPFSTEIAWLARTKVTTGYPDGTFRPNQSVSREAMAAFLDRAHALP